MFQCKIIHDILLYGRKFYMVKNVNSLRFIHCNLFETLPHVLVDCKAASDFWVKALRRWNH